MNSNILNFNYLACFLLFFLDQNERGVVDNG